MANKKDNKHSSGNSGTFLWILMALTLIIIAAIGSPYGQRFMNSFQTAASNGPATVNSSSTMTPAAQNEITAAAVQTTTAPQTTPVPQTTAAPPTTMASETQPSESAASSQTTASSQTAAPSTEPAETFFNVSNIWGEGDALVP